MRNQIVTANPTSTIAALSLAAMIACEAGTTEPEPEPELESEPATAVITGPMDAYMSNSRAPVEFTSLDSEGNISDRVWTIVDYDGVESEPVTGIAFTPQVTEPGLYQVRLQVKGENVEPHDTTHLLEVYPEIDLDFPAPMAFARYTGTGNERTSTLHTFDPRTGMTELLSEQGSVGVDHGIYPWDRRNADLFGESTGCMNAKRL